MTARLRPTFRLDLKDLPLRPSRPYGKRAGLVAVAGLALVVVAVILSATMIVKSPPEPVAGSAVPAISEPKVAVMPKPEAAAVAPAAASAENPVQPDYGEGPELSAADNTALVPAAPDNA
ncbi:MAG: hypothetical protein F4206_03090, partial [Gammaproteobacteria bacterium]|nr:hypothetical protein [Gammaproteobacteria bacterium]